jgi:hypothetical protein
LEQRRANQFCKRFYGQDTTTGGKRYRRVGLLDQVPHRKLTRGVVIIRKHDASKVIKFIQEFGGVEFHVRNIMLTAQDKKALGH